MEVLKRCDVAAAFESLGVTGAALDALLSETSRERHESRVAYARWLAEEYALAAFKLDRNECGEGTLRLAAGAILWADVIGVGGRHGVAGDATQRHPAFRHAGKGRKQARDGGAWSAAILAAAQASGTWITTFPTGVFGTADADGSSMMICETTVPLAWRLSILREGLRRAASLKPWHPNAEIIAPPESLPTWSALLNAALAEMPAPSVGY